jgi:hypothetical protein
MDSVARLSRLRRLKPALEGLEIRSVPSAALPDIAMVSATTTDSKSVSFDYNIQGAAVNQPIQFEVYRSATSQPSTGAQAVAGVVVDPVGMGGITLDQNGNPATAQGAHEITVPVPGGLPPLPAEPYVVVTANPSGPMAAANTSSNSASFRTYVIGVIAHGGVQPKSWKVGGPPWERQMARSLKAQGYDAVIPFNWVAESNTPGAAAKQAPRLARMILATASELPAGSVIDLHLIGHSEGTVVNSQVIQLLNKEHAWTAGLSAGYLKVTMLDPHAASNGVRGQQYSVSNGLLGQIARMEIDAFQSKAKDPAVVVPPNVQDAEVFYQHTPISESGNTNDGIYNLWGQVPVHGPASYFNLTARGISHAGHFGVPNWYEDNVVPTLGTGASFVHTDTLTAAEMSTKASGVAPFGGETVEYSGTAAPGATVDVMAAAAGKPTLSVVARATAGASGTWEATTRPLPAGQYRVVVEANAPDGPRGRPATMRPIVWPGPLTIAPV